MTKALTPRWLPVYVDGKPNKALRAVMHERSGVYVLAERRGRSITRWLYIGQAFTDRAWKTMLRHFQDPRGRFARLGEFSEWFAAKKGVPIDRAALVCAFFPCAADRESAIDLETQAIAHFPPCEFQLEEARVDPEIIPPAAPPPIPFEPRARGVADEAEDFGSWLETIGNPGRSPDDERALQEYVASHWGHEGKAQVRSVQIASFDHGTLVELGELWEVAYGTTKGARGKRALYVHEFARTRPVLAYHHCSRAKCPERGRLAIVGGTYRVEPRGIVG